MITLDTISLSLPKEVISYGIDFDKYLIANFIENRVSEGTYYSVFPHLKPLGVSEIQYNAENKRIKLSLSAKVLKKDYARGISLGTINQVINNLKSSILPINEEQFLRDATIRRIDSTINLTVKKEIKNYLNALKSINTLKAHEIIDYEGETLTLHSANKTKELRYTNTFYNKEKELSKKENNYMREFLNPSEYAGILRNELRLTHHRLTRSLLSIEKPKQKDLTELHEMQKKYNYLWTSKGEKQSPGLDEAMSYKTKSPTLLEVLDSKEKPNLEIFRKIRGKLPKLFLMNPETDKSRYYLESICKDGEYNFNVIDLVLKESLPKTTYYRRIKEVKQFLDERGNDPVERKKINLLLDEIEERMEEAYQ